MIFYCFPTKYEFIGPGWVYILKGAALEFYINTNLSVTIHNCKKMCYGYVFNVV